MTAATDSPNQRNAVPVLRWTACFAVILGLHIAAALLLFRNVTPPPEALPAPPEAIMLDLAAEPAPQAPSPEASDPAAPPPTAQPAPQPPTPEPPAPQPPAPQPPAPQPPTPQQPVATEPPAPAPELPPTPMQPMQPMQPDAEPVTPPKPPDPAPAKTFSEPPPPPRHVAPKRPVRKPVVDHQPQTQTPKAEQEPEKAAAASSPPDKAPAPPASAQPAASSNAQPNWRGELVSRLQRAKRYPDAAREREEHGVATVRFTMDRQGHVLSVTLVRSSGSTALDEEAVALIHRAEPLPALPPEMPGDTITLTAPIAFVLQ
jgi:periplasmic protein TonB